jgi:ubiquinone/menaquinone biosynthesis C-methylase UbiE
MSIRKTLYKTYWALERIMVPSLEEGNIAYEKTLEKEISPDSSWLDLGCGNHLLPSWRRKQEAELAARAERIVGIDAHGPSLLKNGAIKNLVQGDIGNLPFKDHSFDIVTCKMVFEHLADPENQLKEVFRVLKKTGKFIFHTPNSFGYSVILTKAIPDFLRRKLAYLLEGRAEENVFSTYYRVNSPAAIKRLAEGAGFKKLKVNMACSSAHLMLFPPLAFFELLWIRLLLTNRFKSLRPDIIGILLTQEEEFAYAEEEVIGDL